MKFVSTDLPGVVIAEPQVFRDERGFLMGAVWLAAKQKALHGIYHWTDRGVASQYEFAAAI